ncbi:MAG TPA: hypothetical protein VF842_11640 [Flavobacterium sp.]
MGKPGGGGNAFFPVGEGTGGPSAKALKTPSRNKIIVKKTLLMTFIMRKIKDKSFLREHFP